MKVVLFDVDGVLNLVGGEYFSQKYARERNTDPEILENFFRTEWAEVVTGKKDAKVAIEEHKHAWQWDGELDDLFKFWFESENHPDKEALEIVSQLRQRGIKCYVTTNQEKNRGEYIRNVMFPGLFDGYFVSGEMGVKKPDPLYFKAVLDSINGSGLSVQPDEVIFFDDDEDNVDAAKTLGIDAHFYTSIEQLKELLK